VAAVLEHHRLGAGNAAEPRGGGRRADRVAAAAAHERRAADLREAVERVVLEARVVLPDVARLEARLAADQRLDPRHGLRLLVEEPRRDEVGHRVETSLTADGRDSRA